MDNFISKKLKLCFERGKDDLVEQRNLGTDCTVISDGTLIDCLKCIGLLYEEVFSDLNHLRYKLFTKKHLVSSKLPHTEGSAFV